MRISNLVASVFPCIAIDRAAPKKCAGKARILFLRLLYGAGYVHRNSFKRNGKALAKRSDALNWKIFRELRINRQGAKRKILLHALLQDS